MAVNKNNPSIAFVKQFTVTRNTGWSTKYVDIYDNHNLNNGDYKLKLTVQNCPYPMAQYYSWDIASKDSTITSATIDAFGNVKISGEGTICIEGSYTYNSRYVVRIYLTVTQPHVHNFNLWTYNGRSSHIETCACGARGTKTRAHVISASDAGKTHAYCLECGALLDLNYDFGIVMNALSTQTKF